MWHEKEDLMHWKQATLCCAAVLLCASGIFSEPYMVIHKSDGSNVMIPIADIRKITFNLNSPVKEGRKNFDAIKKITAAVKTGTIATAIEYSLQKPGRISIGVFDLRGKMVRDLKKGTEMAGTYRVAWDYMDNDGKRVAAGPYIARVVIDGVPFSRSLYLIQ